MIAIFMEGLGIGNAALAKIADWMHKPLKLNACLELFIGAIASLSPFLIDLIGWAYVQTGCQITLGAFNATLMRLVMAAIVLGVPAMLMGSTLPAAVAAATTVADKNRRAAVVLYGFNTLGTVAGAFASTFVLLQMLGIRSTLWAAGGVNLLLSGCAFSLSNRYVKEGESKEMSAHSVRTGPRRKAAAVPVTAATAQPGSNYVTAGVVGFAFMWLELARFRRLAPVVGGTTFSFGLILSVALLGIGIGGTHLVACSTRLIGRFPSKRDR